MTSKGLSSVVGAVLLMLISVAAAASAWTFVNEISTQTQENVNQRLNEDQKASNAELSTDFVYNSSDGYSIMTLRNTGSVTLTIRGEDGNKNLNMYVRGRPIDGGDGWKFLTSQNTYFALEQDETVNINTTAKFPARGEDYQIRAVGPYETSTTYICYNSGTPSC